MQISMIYIIWRGGRLSRHRSKTARDLHKNPKQESNFQIISSRVGEGVAQAKHKGLPVSGCRLTVRNVECLSKQVNRIKIEPLSRVPGSGFGVRGPRGRASLCEREGSYFGLSPQLMLVARLAAYKSYLSHYKLLSYHPIGHN